MKVQRLLAAVLTAALLLTGCTSLSLSGSDILAPPKAAGSRAELQSMIEKDAKGAYTLIYPNAGAYRSGIILQDLNDDGTEEAIALYTVADNMPRLLIALKQGDSYTQYGSTPLRSSDISRVDFADVNADGMQEVVIGCDVGSPLAALDVYMISENSVNIPVAEGFTDYVIGDFDGSSSADILLMTAVGETAKARLMVCADDGFSEKSSCDIDSNVLSYAKLCFDQISDDMSGAVADGKLSNGEYTTQLLYYDSAAHMLVNPLFLNSSYSESVRSSAVSSADINDDGIIDIPVCTLAEHTKDEDAAAVCSLVRWSNYDPELMALSPGQSGILCDKLGFMLLFGDDRLSALTARYTDENAVTLYGLSYKGSEPVIGNELLTVMRYEKNSYDSSLTAQANLSESASYIYTYILGEGSPFTHDDIKDSFKLLEADES